MNSTKSKKKSKSALIPKPIKIKKEDDHVMYPMEHYVDDRVELIRQIFASLKPKTITNLAPDFLKKSKLEDIQEQCLNEVLGISKKRLLSIINSTKCPTDTDTSGEEDMNIEEHISLEEISSDSDIADQKTTKAPKENEKQFSVLELLELQARARAIRSQLALEPVTKIEVDTDSDEERPQTKAKSASSSASHKKPASVANGSASSKADPGKRPAPTSKSTSKPSNEPAQQSAPTKRIKLKRNFRKHVQNDESNDEGTSNENTTKSNQQIEPKKEARSPSPDVIPIIPVPETLCISDSDDEQSSKKNSANELEATKLPETAKSVQILSVVEIKAPSTSVASTPSVDQSVDPKGEEEKSEVPNEPEEGEILDDEEKTEELPAAETSKPDDDKDKDTPAPKEPEDVSCKQEPAKQDDHEPQKATVVSDEPQKVYNSDSDDDSNDDVISLEGGDLLNEMKEHLDDVTEEPSKEEKCEDIICLDDSSDEEVKPKKNTESWNERWLKSSKVSKVLAASRLGNRVRNKIKESRKAKKLEEAAEIELEQKKAQEYVFTSKHEDGSVEQYKEIQDSLPRRVD